MVEINLIFCYYQFIMSNINLSKNLAVIVKGFIAIVMQIIIIREFLIIFSGNELSLGIILFNWLFLEALGSGWLAKLFSKVKDNQRAYLVLQIFISLSLPLTIWLSRTTKANLGIFYGEAVNLPQMFLISFITLLGFSILDGLQFFFACRLFSDKPADRNITQAYILEALGMLLGGVVFTYIFLPLFNSFQIAFLLAGLAGIAALYLNFAAKIKYKIIFSSSLIFLLALNLGLFATGKIDILQKQSLQKQFPKQKVLDYQNSIYGNVTVTQEQNQLTFFSNGVPAVVSPVTDIALAEEFVHFTLLHHPRPQNILLIGQGAGFLNEMLKEPVNKVDYAELDPLIIREIKKFSAGSHLLELNNPRVNIIYQDGRRLVKSSKEKYDAIFVNMPGPTTLQSNRLFTREFFTEAKGILKSGGLISIRLPGSLTYLNDELKQLNSCIYKTLSAVYRFVLVIPGDFNLFLASDSLDLSKVPIQTLLSRLKERGFKTHLLTPYSLVLRLDETWRDWFFGQIKDVKNENYLNQDFKPLGLFYALAFIYSLISPKTKSLFSLIPRINIFFVAIAVLAVLCLIILSNRKSKKILNLSLSYLILISGLSGITFELILILAFQVIFGFIYAWVGLLTASFMLGLGAGGLFVSSKLNQPKNNLKIFLKLEFAIIAFSIILPLLISFLGKLNWGPLLNLTKLIFLTLSLLAGFILGAEFALANKIYFLQKNREGGESRLYAYDLTGACLGAIISSAVLIPVCGIWQSAAFIALLKLWGIIAVIFCVRKEIS